MAWERVKEPVVIVLDALDEYGTSQERTELVKVLAKLSELPKNFRFLLTSRPEHDIQNTLYSLPDVKHIELTPTESREDVQLYLHQAMLDAFAPDELEQFPESWSWEERMKVLGEAADGLFIWASTAVKIVSGAIDKFACLEILTSNAKERDRRVSLDVLYTTALEASIGRAERTKERFRQILSLILFGRNMEHFTDNIIDGILGFPSANILSRLRSLIVYEHGKPIRFYHTSFREFLTSSDQGGDWFISTENTKTALALRCFGVMGDSLHFNMGELKTSFLPNRDVDGLDERISRIFSQHLLYVCRTWAQHLRNAPISKPLHRCLSEFVYNQLLYWFEVLSLIGEFNVVEPALLDAIAWLPVSCFTLQRESF